MPAANYPELANVPAACRQERPWGFEPLEVRVPYRNFDASVIRVDRLIDPEWPQADYELFAGDSAYDVDEVGGLGYENARELQLLADLQNLAYSTAQDTGGYHPQMRADIVRLAQGARDELDLIEQTYEKYRAPLGEISYLEKERGEGRPQGRIYFPLSAEDYYVSQRIDPTEQPLLGGRGLHREQIRLAWHKALNLLWCALYGRAQSLSYQANVQEWNRRFGGPGGRLTAPPPGAPGGTAPVPTRPIGLPPDVPPGGAPGEPPPIPPLPEQEPGFFQKIPKATKWMLGGSLVLGLVAGGRALWRSVQGQAAAAGPPG